MFLDASTEQPLKSHSLTATCTTGHPKISSCGEDRLLMNKADLLNEIKMIINIWTRKMRDKENPRRE